MFLMTISGIIAHHFGKSVFSTFSFIILNNNYITTLQKVIFKRTSSNREPILAFFESRLSQRFD